MIQTFNCKETRKIFNKELSRLLPHDIQKKALRKLTLIHAAAILQDLHIPPGNRLETLDGNRKGQHSIRINDQWRICFRWEGNNAYEVEIIDYHK